MPDRVLVLGATGFAGAHFAAAARESGLEVVGTARDAGAADVACDLLDRASLERALAESEGRGGSAA